MHRRAAPDTYMFVYSLAGSPGKAGLLPGRGGRAVPGRHRHVVDPDHAQVSRRPQPALGQRLQHTERLTVVAGHDRGGWLRQVEQVAALAPAVVYAEVI